jgi:hypothetical protein
MAGEPVRLDASEEPPLPLPALPDAHDLEACRGPDGRLDHVQVRRFGAGRPKGARNKRSEQLGRLVIQQHGDPILFMASIYGRPLDQVQALAACSRKDALQLQIMAAREVAPFVHGKMPVAVDLAVRGDMVLAIEGLTHSAEAMAELVNGEFVEVEETAENCGFLSGEEGASE